MNGGQTVNVDPVWWVFLVFSSVFINIGMMILFLYTKLEKAEELLHDVEFVGWYKNTFGSSLIGRQARMNAISMVVMMPGVMQKRGEVSQEAYQRLPASLIKQVRALFVFALFNGMGMVGLYFFVY
jgi:hypothetical protein